MLHKLRNNWEDKDLSELKSSYENKNEALKNLKED